MSVFAETIRAIKSIHNVQENFLPLHAPVFAGNERAYVLDTIDSTFVSSVGEYVTRFERMLEEYTGARHVVVCVNGTAALHMALFLAGVTTGDLVITQALSFIATANAICHAGAEPVFLDVDESTLSLSSESLQAFLVRECHKTHTGCVHTVSGKRIAACVPMHTFGFACKIKELCALCEEWGIPLVEDAAESLGSTQDGQHCGTFGLLGSLSFNGNKIVTTGGGGAIITNDPEIAARAKHLTTTAKQPHRWEFRHDAVAWNYRMPNINAALGCAQLERLNEFVKYKRQLAASYAALFRDTPWTFLEEPAGCRSNYWLCSVLFQNREERDAFLTASNDAGVMTRPVWGLQNRQSPYVDCRCMPLPVAEAIAARLVNIPSGCGGAA